MANLVGNNYFSEDNLPYQILLKQANKSFLAEKKIYDLIKADNFNTNDSAIQAFNSISQYTELDEDNYKDFYNFFINHFSSFQEAIKKAIYGENYQFIEYLYDRSFLAEIAVFDDKLTQKIKTITSGSSKIESLDINDPRRSYLEFQKDIQGTQVTSKEEMKTSDTMIKAGKDLLKMINDSNLFETEIPKKYEELITNYIIDQGIFTFGFSGGKKMGTVELLEYIDNTYKGKASKGGKVTKKATLMSGELNEDQLEDKKYPLFNIDILNEMKRDNPNLEIYLFGSKQVLKPILSSALDFLQKQGFKLIENSDNGFKTELDSTLNDSYSLNNEESLKAIAKEGARAFLDKIYKVLSSKNKDAAMQFASWRGSVGGPVDQQLEQMIKNDPHILKVILQNKDLAQVIGTLGEVMISLLFNILKSDTSLHTNISKVEVLGQTNFGMGDAAVDIKILTKDLTAIGLQVKTYSSIGSTIDLYSQSSILNEQNSKYIQRYIERSGLDIINSIFFRYYKNPGDTLAIIGNSDEGERNSLNKAKNIFEQHIPYFLRFDEAQIEKQSQDLTQNNFFIINFNFVPTSIIFLTIVKSFEQEKDQIYTSKNLFHFSSEKESGDRLPERDYFESWKTAKENIKEKGYSDNLVTGLENNLYINFIGAKIKFKDELKIVINKT